MQRLILLRLEAADSHRSFASLNFHEISTLGPLSQVRFGPLQVRTDTSADSCFVFSIPETLVGVDVGLVV